MSSTYRSRTRDQRIADDTIVDRELLCAANSCPNRWTVDAGKGRLCSAHGWADRHQWPSITQQQLDAETARALAKAVADSQPQEPTGRLSREQKLAILHRLRGLDLGASQARQPRHWARVLREREAAGAELTPAQREAWRAAIGASVPVRGAPIWRDGDLNDAKNRAAQAVSDYLVE